MVKGLKFQTLGGSRKGGVPLELDNIAVFFHSWAACLGFSLVMNMFLNHPYPDIPYHPWGWYIHLHHIRIHGTGRIHCEAIFGAGPEEYMYIPLHTYIYHEFFIIAQFLVLIQVVNIKVNTLRHRERLHMIFCI